MNKVGIILLNYNGRKYLEGCIDSVFKQNYTNYKLFFVDNGSSDDSIKFVKSKYPDVELLILKKNFGFAGGMNEGIKKCLSYKNIGYVVCLNNDTILDANWLKNLVLTAEKHNCDMVSSKAYFENKEIQNAGLEFPLYSNRYQNGGISIGYGKRDSEVTLKSDKEIFSPGGVAPLYSRKFLEELYSINNEYFDNDFFAYAEDLDIGFVGRILGYKAYLSSGATLTHFHSRTGGSASNFKIFYSTRNGLLVGIKNLPKNELLNYFIANIKRLNSARAEINNKKGNKILKYFTIIRAYIGVLVLTPTILRKRFKIRKNKKISDDEIIAMIREFRRDNVEKK